MVVLLLLIFVVPAAAVLAAVVVVVVVVGVDGDGVFVGVDGDGVVVGVLRCSRLRCPRVKYAVCTVAAHNRCHRCSRSYLVAITSRDKSED